MTFDIKSKLLLGTAVTALSFGVANVAMAADQSADIEAGTAVTIDGTDTFVIDNTNDGEGQATAVTFNGTGANTFTVDSAGADATGTADSAEIGTISVTNAGGTNTFTFEDATNADALTLVITGAISGDVATDANDLNIVVNALTTDDGGDSTLDVNGDVDLGTGTIALTGDANDLSTLLVSGAADQTITGAITSTTDNAGSAVVVNNGTNTATFVSAIGVVGANGVENLTIGDGTAGGQAVFSSAVNANNISVAGTTAASTADFNGNVVSDAGITITAHANGAATATFAGNVTGALTLDDATNTATATFDGSAAQTVTGDITVGTAGEGVININNSTTVTGRVGANAVGAVNVATGQTFTLDTTNTANAINTTTLTGTGAFVIDATDAGGDTTLTGAVAAAADGAGVLRAIGTQTVIVTGAVGASGTDVGAIQVTGLTTAKGLTLQGDVYANGVAIDATNATDENTVTFGNGADTLAITGNITSAEDGEHTLVFNSSTAASVSGYIGTSSAAFKTLTFTEGATVGGNIYATGATVANAETLVLTGTSATVSPAFTGSTGNITVGNGTDAASATFTGALDIDAVTVEDAATATFSSTVETDANLVVGGATTAGTATFNSRATIGGTVDIDGTALFANENATTANTFSSTVDIAANSASTVTLAGHADVDGTLTIGSEGATLLIKKTSTFDPTDADGNGTANEATDMVWDATFQTVTTTGTLTVGISADTDAIDTGSEITVLVGNNAANFGTEITAGTIVLQDSALIDIQDNGSDADELKIKYVAKSASSVIGADSTGVAAADRLLGLANATVSGDLETIKGNLQGSATASAAEAIAESITTTVDGGSIVAATTVTNISADIVNTQVASLRNGETGMTAGNVAQGLRVWGQAFGQTGEQDKRDGVDGYDVDTLGFAAGIDTETLADDWIWGLAFSYASTDVDSNNENTTETEVDTYQIAVYANYDWDERTYITGQLGYAFGDNDVTRHNVGGISGLNTSGDFDSQQFTARAEAGRSYEVGSNTTLTPNFLVNYAHYDADGYSEDGTSTARLVNIESEEINILEFGVGIDASWLYQQADGAYFKPELRAGVRHDVIGDEVESTSTFAAGGSSFKTEGFDPAQTTFTVGAGVTYFSTDNWELSADYDYEAKSDFDAHSGVLRAAYKF